MTNFKNKLDAKDGLGIALQQIQPPSWVKKATPPDFLRHMARHHTTPSTQPYPKSPHSVWQGFLQIWQDMMPLAPAQSLAGLFAVLLVGGWMGFGTLQIPNENVSPQSSSMQENTDMMIGFVVSLDDFLN